MWEPAISAPKRPAPGQQDKKGRVELTPNPSLGDCIFDKLFVELGVCSGWGQTPPRAGSIHSLHVRMLTIILIKNDCHRELLYKLLIQKFTKREIIKIYQLSENAPVKF